MASLFSLPNEVILSTLNTQFPCRNHQIRSLATLLAIRGAPSRNIVLHGLHSTGKTAITKALLEKLSNPHAQNGFTNGEFHDEDQLRYAIVKSAECISGRHLLEQTIGAVAQAIDWNGDIGRCENLAQLPVSIGRMMEKWIEGEEQPSKRRLVLVFDGIDQQRETPATLFPALGRLGEIIPKLTILYIITSPRPNFLHLPGVPHIHFPTYTKPEILSIVSSLTPTPSLPSGEPDTHAVWQRFCPAVYDSLSKHSGRDILSFRTMCLTLWPQFIAPIIAGTYYPTPFSRLLVANKALFQNNSILVPSIVAPKPPSTTKTSTNTTITKAITVPKLPALATQLPFHTRLLLLAAYLASFNPPRTDILYFMKSATSRRRKRGGGTALSRTSAPKNRKISRKLLGAQAFVLERMLAIFRCLNADAANHKRYARGRRGGSRRLGEGRWETEDPSGSADIYTAIATLTSLRLLIRMGSVSTGDVLEGSAKYKVAVGWEVVRGIGRSVGVEMEDYLAE
ncbi:hypothetical protein HYFRA_00006671 [Hymenoscyphus fraxineus]|uniref:Orc1-like AAA ATPase domain-containing protein n=1 Tax=Hymenoscyphus fraxineus TaxID=746836 RepID=A0A9N9PS44_9HELO|nr:hypothetical protein HYFRA_00006671 [Hymenoscyphus fraxineus]